jgi:hypothetical protein
VATPLAAIVEELLAREGELTRREEAFTGREEKARISEKAHAQVSASLDEEQTKAEAALQEYLDKMAEHTARGRQVLNFDKMLGEKRAKLDGREQDLELSTATLAKVQARGINPRDNCDELMEFIMHQQLLQDVEMDCIIEAGWLAALDREVSQVLENLCLPPISGIPWDPHTAGDVLGAVDVILERMKEAYDSSHNPWD